jgi:Protein of unknown function (DUF3467)
VPGEIKQTPVAAGAFKIVEPPEGASQVYANVSHLTWTGMDITVQLYQLDQPNRELPELVNAPTTLVHEANVTFTWAAAKTFHKMLGDVLQRYEKVYGPIKTEFQQI